MGASVEITREMLPALAKTFASKGILRCFNSNGDPMEIRIAKGTALEIVAENSEVGFSLRETVGVLRTRKTGRVILSDRGNEVSETQKVAESRPTLYLEV